MAPIRRFPPTLRTVSLVKHPTDGGMLPINDLPFISIPTITPLEHVTPVQEPLEHFDTTDTHDQPVSPLLLTSVAAIKSHKKLSSTLE